MKSATALGNLLRVLDDLNLTPHQQSTAPAIVRKHLDVFASGEDAQPPAS